MMCHTALIAVTATKSLPSQTSLRSVQSVKNGRARSSLVPSSKLLKWKSKLRRDAINRVNHVETVFSPTKRVGVVNVGKSNHCSEHPGRQRYYCPRDSAESFSARYPHAQHHEFAWRG